MARRGRLLAFVAIASSATLVACSLLTGLDADYTLQTAGGEAGKDGDIPGDGPGGDATNDSQPPVDGGPDAKTDGSFCDGIDRTNVFKCFDFEDAAAPKFGWSSVKADEGDASVTVDPSVGYLGTDGLKFIMTKGAVGSPAAWLDEIVFSGNPRQNAHYEIEFEFQELAMQISYTAFANLTFPSGGADREHGIGNYMATYFSKLQPENLDVADEQKWHHGLVRLDRADGGTTFDRTITIDRKPVDATKGLSSPTTGGVEFRLGTFNTGLQSGLISAAFDNVVIRVW